jgi:hypothetical protein
MKLGMIRSQKLSVNRNIVAAQGGLLVTKTEEF